MSEAEAMQDWSDECEYDYLNEIPEPKQRTPPRRLARKPGKRVVPHTRDYKTAKAASVGSMVMCPGCGKHFVKSSYQQAFCSNKGRDNCKDWYWNLMRENS